MNSCLYSPQRNHFIPYIIITFMISGSLLAAIFGSTKTYPFFSYPMYSQVFTPQDSFKQYSLIGIRRDTGQRAQVDIGDLLPNGTKFLLFNTIKPHSMNREQMKLIISDLLNIYNRKQVDKGKPELKLRTLILENAVWNWSEFVKQKLISDDPMYIPPHKSYEVVAEASDKNG